MAFYLTAFPTMLVEGTKALYNVTEDVGLTGGIHFSKALSMKGESGGEKLQFNNTHFSFGVIIQAY